MKFASTLQRVVLFCAMITGLLVPASSQTQLPDGKGKDVVETGCTQCHGLQPVVNLRLSREEWQNIVYDMVARGTPLTEEEMGLAVDYLATNFPKPKPSESTSTSTPSNKIYVNKATTTELENALGITPQEAAAVVRYREKNGNFGQWEDLKKVPGLDARKIEAKKDRLAF